MDNAAEVLRQAALDLVRTLDLGEVLEKLLGHLSVLVPYDTANAMLVEPDGRLAVRAARGYETWGDPEGVRRLVLEPGAYPILTELIATGKSVLIPDTTGYPGWHRNESASHVKNFIGVPLQAGGRVIGLYALDKSTPGFFSAEHVRRTEALAPHAAIAIQNARLFERMQASEGRFRSLVEHTVEAMWLVDPAGFVTWSTESAADLLGAPLTEIVGHSAFRRVHPEDSVWLREEFARALAHPGQAVRARFRMIRGDGRLVHLAGVGVNRLADPNVHAVAVNLHDVTASVLAAERIEDLNRSLERQVAEFQTLIDVLPIGIAIARDRECRFIEPNPNLAHLMGIGDDTNASLSAPPGERPLDNTFAKDGAPIDPSRLPMQTAAAQGVVVKDFEMDLVRGGEKVATVLGYAAPLFDESGVPRGAIGASLDITERKRAEDEIRRLAYHDTLTGLPNRLLFRDHLDLAIAQARRGGPGLAILFLDVDRFKVVNDSLGHSHGDDLIRAIAERLRTAVREGDTVARLGGDEFIVLVPGAEQAVAVAKVAEKIVAALREPFHLRGREIFATASIGISVYPSDGADAETLVKNADAAMYRAKDMGRDSYQMFTPALNDVAAGRLDLENRLRKALPHGELELHYQPLADVATGGIYGVEALLRWRHPERGLLLPADFLGLAESTGLILPMGPWVLATACAQARAWEAAGIADVSVSVNLSARQFQDADLAQHVWHVLADSKLNPARLVIEITESSAMQNAAAAVATLHELKDLGVRVAIDDFGTGYSSLAYLKRFPIDILKIDQSFVRDLPHDADDAAIATAVIALGRTLKLDVVAEGVETAEQMAFLRERGCHRAQGGLFSRPVPASECEVVLRDMSVPRLS